MFKSVTSMAISGTHSSHCTLLLTPPSNMNPGGWMEMQEPKLPALCDDDTYAGTALERWQNLAVEASKKLGAPMDIASSCKETMISVGFEDVTEAIFKWPI